MDYFGNVVIIVGGSIGEISFYLFVGVKEINLFDFYE